MQLQFDDKKILHVQPIAKLLREGEKNVDRISITGPAQYEGMDLSTLHWAVCGNYADYPETAMQTLTGATAGGNLTLTWIPDETFTAHHGGMDLILVGTDDGGSQVIKITADMCILIRPAARRAGAGGMSALERIYNAILAIAKQASEWVEAAAASASAAAKSAQTAGTAATAAAGSASDAAKSASGASASAGAAAESQKGAEGWAKTAESWAVGGTKTRQGEDTDNAKYYAGQAAQAAKVAGDAATEVIEQGIAEKLAEMEKVEAAAKADAEKAGTAADTAVKARDAAQGAAKDAAESLTAANDATAQAQGYADAAKQFANQTAAGTSPVTWGWDADGYWSVFETVDE